MSDKDEPAFPCPMTPYGEGYGGFTEVRFTGLTIRDYFAAQALQGMLAYSNPSNTDGDWYTNASAGAVAQNAYVYADAMMKARNQ